MKTALLFPGQGAQIVGMAKDFHDNFKESRLVFEEASDATHVDLKRLCFEGPLADLTLTENLQPSLFTAEMAMLAGLRAHVDLTITAYLGHSLGEYAALAAAGSLSVSDGARLTKLRGKAMQEAVPVGVGAMAAVIGPEAPAVRELCLEASRVSGKVVEPANYNAPGQVVISGHSVAVAKAGEILSSNENFKRAKFMPLQVSAPFHCALMAPARESMSAPLTATAFRKPSAPVVCNVTALPCDQEHQFPGLLLSQITGSVRWQECVEALPALLTERCIEVGPGTVLTGLMKRINRAMLTLSVSNVEALKEITK